MIQVTVKYKDHHVDIHFPCSESELLSALMELHAANDNPAELFITDIEYPKELSVLKDRFINIDELNFLAKRMESFWGLEETQFYEAAKYEGFTDLKDLINLTMNLNRYTLIQSIGDMAEIGREYTLNTKGCIPTNDLDNPKYAKLGKQLIVSGEGIFTEHGLLFVDKDTPFAETYDGQVFPPYLYDSSLIITAIIEYGRRKEYVYLPCEELAINKALKRLGVKDIENSIITLEDFNVDNKEWFEKMKKLCTEEGIYSLNRLVQTIKYADMDLDKLSAIIKFADVDGVDDIVRLAENLELFEYVPNATDYETIGRHFLKIDPEYQIHPELEKYLDYEKLGKAIAKSREGVFLDSGGYICLERECRLVDILDIDDSMKMGGM